MTGSKMVTMRGSAVGSSGDVAGGSVARLLVGKLEGHGTLGGMGQSSTFSLGGLVARSAGSELAGHTNA